MRQINIILVVHVVSKAAYIPVFFYICTYITSEEGSELILFSGKVPQTAGD